MKKVAIYVRVSTDIQVEGHSIDEQLDRLRKYCDAHSWKIYKEYIDPGFSGSNVDRPALTRLLQDAKKKRFDMVLVYKLDRLSRSQKDTLYLIEEEFLPRNIDFVSMSENFDTSTPFGKAMIGILSVFAQLEREQIKERMAMGQIARAKQGYWRAGSNTPIGYDYVDGMLVINEYEAMQIRKIYQMFLEGYSIHAITDHMHANYTNKYSSYADSSQTGVILKNRLYIGKIKYKGVEYDGVHEPIIDMETFEKVQERYKHISANWSSYWQAPYRADKLLTGLMYCGHCGARYFSTSSQHKGHRKYNYYKCYTRDGNTQMKRGNYCKNPTYRMDYLDNIVLDEISKLHFTPNYLMDLAKNSPNEEADSIATINKRLSEIDKQINKLMDLYALGTIPIEMIAERVKPLNTEKTQLEATLYKHTQERKKARKMTVREAKKTLKQYFDGDTSDHDAQRAVITALIEKITIEPEQDCFTIQWKFA